MCPPLFGIYLRTDATKPAGYEDVSPAYGQTPRYSRGATSHCPKIWIMFLCKKNWGADSPLRS